MITDALRLSPLASEAAELLQTLAHPDRLLIVCDLINGEQSVEALQDRVGLSLEELKTAINSLVGYQVIAEVNGKADTYRLADVQAAEIVDALCSAYLGQEFSGRAKIPFRSKRFLQIGDGKNIGAGI